jgi:hypothetical protein
VKKTILKRIDLLSLFLIFLYTIPAILPLLHRGFFLSDDGEWMVVRLTAFFEAVRHLQIPARFLLRLNNEFGYPLSNFAYPGFLYIGSIIHLLHFGFIDSVKIIMFLSLFLGSVFSYFFLRKRFDFLSSLIGSFIYLYTPYHLFDLYKRGSVGELLSLAIIPFIFWQIERKSKGFLAIGVFLLILSHNIIAFISLPFAFLYTLLIYKENLKKNLFNILAPFIVGILLSTFFWLPSIYDLRYIIFSGLKIADWHLFFATVQVVGISSFIILFFPALLFPKESRKPINLFFIILTIFSIFMGTKISTPIWNIIPSSFIIFPFRFLSILPLGLGFLGALLIFNVDKKYKLIVAGLLAVLVFYCTIPFISPSKYLDRDDNFYLNNFATTTAANEYMPKWVKTQPIDIPKKRIETVGGDAIVFGDSLNSGKIIFTSSGSKPSTVRVNVIYFPGWVASVDGINTSINYQNKGGVMEINVPKGQHSVIIRYKEIDDHLFADIISLIGIIALAGLFIWERKYVSK